MNAEPKRDRSPNCPKQTLSEAIALAKTLYSKGGKSKINPLVAASALGYASLNGSALTALGVLNQYGLLDKDESGGVSVSAEALMVLHPKSDEEKLYILRHLAVKPKVFRELYANGFHKCDEAVLANHLIQNSFSAEAAKKVASVFKENSELAKLDDDSINLLEVMKQTSQTPSHVAVAGKPVRGTLPIVPPPAGYGITHHDMAPEYLEAIRGERQASVPLVLYRFPIGANEAIITIRGERLSSQDFDALIEYINLFKKQYERKQKAAEGSFFDSFFNTFLSGSAFPVKAIWKNAHNDKPVTLVAEMGKKDGVRYFQSDDGTGIPETELTLAN